MKAETKFKLGKFFDLFKYGNAVADANTWANRATAVSAITALIAGIAAMFSAFGHPLGLDSEQIDAIALGVAAVVIFIVDRMHVAANDKAGHKPKE